MVVRFVCVIPSARRLHKKLPTGHRPSITTLYFYGYALLAQQVGGGVRIVGEGPEPSEPATLIGWLAKVI